MEKKYSLIQCEVRYPLGYVFHGRSGVLFAERGKTRLLGASDNLDEIRELTVEHGKKFETIREVFHNRLIISNK